jgi:hypothetical protein
MTFKMEPRKQAAFEQRLEDLARRSPHGFTLLLILVAVAVTVGLLFAVSPPVVLYQGF